ncbi:MAG: hypothetical protein FWB71_01390 [Defluviitaleaceae bacterium]|nr:hypothetical protein [Defluviitaleaceae bacterium]
MIAPVNNIQFRVGVRGRASQPGDMHPVRDMETFSVNFNNGIESFYPIDGNGWARRLMTSKSLTISLSGKRNYLDRGNNYVAGLAYLSGEQTYSILEATFPNGDTLRMNCCINVTSSEGGAATEIAGLDFECISDGAPMYIAG